MLRDVRKMLDQIDAFLCRGDQESTDLAYILSAVRGPDNGSDMDKTRYTAPVRAAAFPLLAASADSNGFASDYCGWQIGGELPPEASIEYRGSQQQHYLRHINTALKAINRKEP